MDYLSGDLELSLQPREDHVLLHRPRADRPADDTHAIFYPLRSCYRSGPQDAFPPWHVLAISLLRASFVGSQPFTSVRVIAGYHKA